MNPNPLKFGCLAAGCLLLQVCMAQNPPETGEATTTFGVTVVAPFGFCGRIYEMPEPPPDSYFPSDPQMARPGSMQFPGAIANESVRIYSAKLPKFERLQPISIIYTTKLNVQPRDFKEGFPGVTGRFEWFAIDYTARFRIETPGKYSFRLLSDDGSALYIDERRIIDNDYVHAPLSVSGSARLDYGIHDMRVGYFQGPRWQVALVLEVKSPGGKWRIFDTQEFRPPANPASWKSPDSANLDVPVDPCKVERHPRKLLSRP